MTYMGPPPNPDEVATIYVRMGSELGDTPASMSGVVGAGAQTAGSFTDWEQVYVQRKYFSAYDVFRFNAVERDPIPKLWGRLQFRPGDEVGIYLGGILAMAGQIEIRQTAYDANSHGVMLQGTGSSKWAAKSTITKNDQGLGAMAGGAGGQQMKDELSFDNKNFQQIASEILPKYGITPKFLGMINPWPFKILRADPGETVFNFLERIARPRGVVIGTTKEGMMSFLGENGLEQITDTLVEGVNILRAQVIWSNEEAHSHVGVKGSTPADDGQNGQDASQQVFYYGGRALRFSPIVTVAEQPVWNLAEIADRARNEARWRNSDVLLANITVVGWKKSDGDLWRPGDMVKVVSPMAMLNDVLAAESVTYTQDSAGGTVTTLELVLPWRLGDQSHLGQGGDRGLPVNDPNATEPTFATMQTVDTTPPPATLDIPPPQTPPTPPPPESSFGTIPGPPLPVNPPFGGT